MNPRKNGRVPNPLLYKINRLCDTAAIKQKELGEVIGISERNFCSLGRDNEVIRKRYIIMINLALYFVENTGLTGERFLKALKEVERL